MLNRSLNKALAEAAPDWSENYHMAEAIKRWSEDSNHIADLSTQLFNKIQDYYSVIVNIMPSQAGTPTTLTLDGRFGGSGYVYISWKIPHGILMNALEEMLPNSDLFEHLQGLAGTWVGIDDINITSKDTRAILGTKIMRSALTSGVNVQMSKVAEKSINDNIDWHTVWMEEAIENEMQKPGVLRFLNSTYFAAEAEESLGDKKFDAEVTYLNIGQAHTSHGPFGHKGPSVKVEANFAGNVGFLGHAHPQTAFAELNNEQKIDFIMSIKDILFGFIDDEWGGEDIELEGEWSGQYYRGTHEDPPEYPSLELTGVQPERLLVPLSTYMVPDHFTAIGDITVENVVDLINSMPKHVKYMAHSSGNLPYFDEGEWGESEHTFTGAIYPIKAMINNGHGYILVHLEVH